MKTPERRQAFSGAVGEQLNLIDPPPFSPIWPKRSTLAGEALERLLRGDTLTHPQFESLTGSWRLSEPIRSLRHEYGWPVETIEIPCPTEDCPSRYIAMYELPQWVIEEIRGAHVD